MATYEYRCGVCGKSQAITRLMSDEEVLPRCCLTDMARVWEAAPIHFKGSGFYKTGG